MKRNEPGNVLMWDDFPNIFSLKKARFRNFLKRVGKKEFAFISPKYLQKEGDQAPRVKNRTIF